MLSPMVTLINLSFSIPGWVRVILLWLDPGLELDPGEPSGLRLPGPESAGWVIAMVVLDPSYPPRLLAIEFSLLKPEPAWALHLLLTLSERFSIALWTKPPRPLVGDGGRSIRSGDIRPWEGDIANVRLLGDRSPPCDDVESDGGSSNLWL
jgi:hypothetical protein